MRRTTRLVATLGLLLLSLAASTLFAAVDLAYFRGQWSGNSVRVEWGTGTEVDHAGFNIWRSTENIPISGGQIDTSRAEKLNGAIITNPDGICLASGQDYQFTDNDISDSVNSYYYYLESIPCAGSGSDFEGAQDGRQGGLEVRNPDAPTPTVSSQASATRTPVASPTATRQGNVASPTTEPSATAQASATSSSASPTSTGTNSTPATTTPEPASTSTNSAAASTATRQVESQATTGTTSVQSETQQGGSDEDNGAEAPSVLTTEGESNQDRIDSSGEGDAAGAAVENDGENGSTTEENSPASEAPGGTESLSAAPTSTMEIALDSDNPAPGGSADGTLSAGLEAATPTVPSMLAGQPTTPNQELFAQETSSDGLDRVIQGVIAILVLGAVALIGFVGWTYVRR